MESKKIKNKWWYRLLKVVYYGAYIYTIIISIFAAGAIYIEEKNILGILFIPLVIIIFEFIYWLLYYVSLGKTKYAQSFIGTFTILGIFFAGNKIKEIYQYKFNRKTKRNTIGYGPSIFALAFLFLCLPLVLIILFLNSIPGGELFMGLFGMILLLILIHFGTYRLKNAGKSVHLMWLVVIPGINLILLGILFFSGTKQL